MVKLEYYDSDHYDLLILSLSILLLSSLVVFLTIIVTKPFFIRYDFLDHSNSRKNHMSSVPLNGGIAMLSGLAFGLIFNYYNYENYLVLIVCSSLICFLGFADDIVDLSPNLRILTQIAICLIAISFGFVEIYYFGNVFGFGEIYFDRLIILITVLALLTGMNSFNLVDGIDGLSSGIAIIAFSSILYLSLLANNFWLDSISILYIFILIPFFILNISKKKVFMGDSGSLLIGFGIAWVLIDSSQGNEAFINPVTNLWIYAIPLFDISSVIVLRIKNKKSIFKPDNSHIHNQLINRLGISHKKALAILLFSSACFSLAGIVMQGLNAPEWIMFYSLLAILILYIAIISSIDSKKQPD